MHRLQGQTWLNCKSQAPSLPQPVSPSGTLASCSIKWGSDSPASHWQHPWSTLPYHCSSLHSSTLSFIHTRFIPSSGPLHLLFSLPRTPLLPSYVHSYSSLSFRAQLKQQLLRKSSLFPFLQPPISVHNSLPASRIHSLKGPPQTSCLKQLFTPKLSPYSILLFYQQLILSYVSYIPVGFFQTMLIKACMNLEGREDVCLVQGFTVDLNKSMKPQ